MPVAEAARAAALDYLTGPSPGNPATTVLDAARSLEGTPDGDPVLDWPEYQGRPVRPWRYQLHGLPGWVLLLNPAAEQLAGWIGAACEHAGSATPQQHGRTLAEFIVGQNGAQFPVAGVIVEREQEAGGAGPTNDPVYLEYRDGVTVRTEAGFDRRKTPLTTAECKDCARAEVTRAKTYARLAMAIRADYLAANGPLAVGADKDHDPQCLWLQASRESYLAAFDTGQYSLLNLVAKRLYG